MKPLRWVLVLCLVAAGVLVDPRAAAAAKRYVTVGGQSHVLNGTNVRRRSGYLVKYTPVRARTRTDRHGFEAAVVGGRVTRVADGVGNMAVPRRGYVLSGNGAARRWLRTHARVGAVVRNGRTPPPPPPPPAKNALLPDIGVRTLRQFTISTSTGRTLLKFPAVTANVGKGPLEILGTRPSTDATSWTGRQVVTSSDGSRTTLPATGATFYYAGDGHDHWHIRDFDLYQLFDASGTLLQEGEKHGFCFEDNTAYRDWVGSPQHPDVPLSPVYTHEGSCGEDQPLATRIVHGLSVGWGDTYPASLPDQGIDITGIPDGTYRVKVTADWQNFWRETDERDNSASAQIRISGDTVTLLSATDGL